MAIVDNPGFSFRASGNLGALNYYISRGRQIARARKPTGMSSSSSQIVIQGYLTSAISAWKNSLTQTQREEWRRYAMDMPRKDRLGRKRAIPGYNLFISMYIRASNLGQTPVYDPPVEQFVGGFDSYYYDWVSALSYFRCRPDGWFDSARPDGFEWWIAGPFDDEGRQGQNNEFYFELYHAGSGIVVSNPKTSGKYYWSRIRWVMNDGRHGNWIQFQMYAG